MKYGYARVSTDGQSVDAQARQLTRAGCKKMLREVVSGAKADRSQLRRPLDHLAAGDVLMVIGLDRLARSTRHLLTSSPRSPTRGLASGRSARSWEGGLSGGCRSDREEPRLRFKGEFKCGADRLHG
jgi:hypothetical protein